MTIVASQKWFLYGLVVGTMLLAQWYSTPTRWYAFILMIVGFGSLLYTIATNCGKGYWTEVESFNSEQAPWRVKCAESKRVRSLSAGIIISFAARILIFFLT